MTIPQSMPFPAGYLNAKYPPPYVPWSGSLNSPSPARILNGGAQEFSVASVPADLSSFILNAPNGKVYTFQFVYNASVQNLAGSIKIPLPASGASTAAQVTTQIVNALSTNPSFALASAVPVFFDFGIGQGAANHFTIGWSVPGATIAPGGTQATIAVIGTFQQQFTLGDTVPGKVGPMGAFLRG